jgi:hypothetical protein
MTGEATNGEELLRRLNTAIPHPARVYDVWLGGEDNYPADQAAGAESRVVYGRRKKSPFVTTMRSRGSSPGSTWSSPASSRSRNGAPAPSLRAPPRTRSGAARRARPFRASSASGQAETRSHTKMSVSPGLILFPAPRFP